MYFQFLFLDQRINNLPISFTFKIIVLVRKTETMVHHSGGGGLIPAVTTDSLLRGFTDTIGKGQVWVIERTFVLTSPG